MSCKYRVKIAQVYRLKTAQLSDVKIHFLLISATSFFSVEGWMRPEAEACLPRRKNRPNPVGWGLNSCSILESPLHGAMVRSY